MITKYSKRHSLSPLSTIMFIMVATLMTAICSCEKADISNNTGGSEENNQEATSGKSHKVTIVARSATSQTMNYPIDIYAYNSLGEETAHQTVTSASESINMTLWEGQYTIAAVSGMSGFDTAKGYSTTPIMTGSTTVTVGSSALTANIVLSYAVTALDLSLTDVPTSVTAVSVTVGQQYASVSNLREYSGSGSVTIPCTSSGSAAGTWQTGTVYLLPGCKESTELTIALTAASGTTSYGITYPSALRAATPYHFTGSYKGESSGVTVTGSLSCDDWLSAVEGSFSFGPTGTGSFSGQDANVETIKVSSIPSQGSVYDGHLIALVSDNGNGSSDALLISIKEWDSLTSALYEADPTVAQELANGYTEGSLSGWSIPTTEQVKSLKEVWTSDNITTLNNALADISGSTALSVTDDAGKNVRYLCENATYTYSWSKTGGIVAAGKTVKTYRLRVVKKVRFIAS